LLPLVRHYFSDLSVAEIAHRLDVTHGTVKTRLWRARRLLRIELENIMERAPVPEPVGADSISMLASTQSRYPSMRN
jgi:hypothetical protein